MKRFFQVLSFLAMILSFVLIIGYCFAFFVIPDTSLPMDGGIMINGVHTLLLLIAGYSFYKWNPPYRKQAISLCFLLWCGFYLICVVKVNLFDGYRQPFTYNGIPFFSLGHTVQWVRQGYLPLRTALPPIIVAFFLCWPVCITLSAIGNRLSRRDRLLIAGSVPIVLELLQGVMQRGTADIDDILLGFAGIGVYYLVCRLLSHMPVFRRLQACKT